MLFHYGRKSTSTKELGKKPNLNTNAHPQPNKPIEEKDSPQKYRKGLTKDHPEKTREL